MAMLAEVRRPATRRALTANETVKIDEHCHGLMCLKLFNVTVILDVIRSLNSLRRHVNMHR